MAYEALAKFAESVVKDDTDEFNRLFESDDEEDDDDKKKSDSDDFSDNDAIDMDADKDPPEPADDDDTVEFMSDDEEDENDSILNTIAEKLHLSKNETEILDDLIESETDAISDYSKALNETKNKHARALLTEILNDESRHLTQLSYLKSMGTDGEYVPKDKEATDELADILESILDTPDDEIL